MGAHAAALRGQASLLPRLRAISGLRGFEIASVTFAGIISLAAILSFTVGRDLQGFIPGPTPSVVNIGLAMLAGCLGVAFHGRRIGTAFALFCALLGGLTLVEHVGGVSLGIDKLFADPWPYTQSYVTGGRMAPNTAFCCLMVGLGLLLRGRVATACAGAAALVALIGLLGHTAADANVLASVGRNAKMALPTAIAGTFLSIGVVLHREHAFFTRTTVGGTVTRRLGPAIILLPLIGGALLQEGIHDGTFTAASGIWVMTVAAVVVSLTVLFWISQAVDQQEGKAHAWLSQQAATADALNEGLVVRRESDGQIMSVNPALEAMFGFSREQLVGTSRRLVTSDHEAGMHHAVVEGTTYNTELETVRADGTPFWASLKASSFKDPDHGLMRVALYHDITERRTAEAERQGLARDREKAIDELERSNKELEQFAHVASHDLSEPLRVVAGFTGLIQRRYKGKLDDDADQFIDATISGVERMQALIDALLAYSRVGSGELKRELVDIGKVVDQVHDALGVRITEAGGQIEVEGDMPTVAADPVLLQRVFQNLISNAMKFTGDEPPRIVVSAEATGVGEWTFRVEDNGEGIPPEHTERVFGMFQRLHGRERPGTGIGLSITRRIVEKHGGQIWVVPAEAGGSVFTFTIGVSDK